MKSFIILLIAPVLLMFACTPVRFDQAQPAYLPVLNAFPAELQGTYLSYSSDTATHSVDTIFITPKSFIYFEDDHHTIPLANASALGIVVNDFSLTWNEKYPGRSFKYELNADTLRFLAYREVDKILSDSVKIKQLKKDIYLSTLDSLGWEVLLLRETKKAELTLYMFSIQNNDQELKQYTKITPIEKKQYSPTFEYYFLKPTPKELQKLIKAGMTKPVATLKKIK